MHLERQEVSVKVERKWRGRGLLFGRLGSGLDSLALFVLHKKLVSRTHSGFFLCTVEDWIYWRMVDLFLLTEVREVYYLEAGSSRSVFCT